MSKGQQLLVVLLTALALCFGQNCAISAPVSCQYALFFDGQLLVCVSSAQPAVFRVANMSLAPVTLEFPSQSPEGLTVQRSGTSLFVGHVSEVGLARFDVSSLQSEDSSSSLPDASVAVLLPVQRLDEFSPAVAMAADGPDRLLVGRNGTVSLLTRDPDGDWTGRNLFPSPKNSVAFGSSLAVGQKVLVVGDRGSGSDRQGAVYIYERSFNDTESEWNLTASLSGLFGDQELSIGLVLFPEEDAVAIGSRFDGGVKFLVRGIDGKWTAIAQDSSLPCPVQDEQHFGQTIALLERGRLMLVLSSRYLFVFKARVVVTSRGAASNWALWETWPGYTFANKVAPNNGLKSDSASLNFALASGDANVELFGCNGVDNDLPILMAIVWACAGVFAAAILVLVFLCVNIARRRFGRNFKPAVVVVETHSSSESQTRRSYQDSSIYTKLKEEEDN